jgi:hypothetical protein
MSETPDPDFERRLEQANAIIQLLAPDARIEKKTTRYYLLREAPRGDDPTRLFRRQFLIAPDKPRHWSGHLQSGLFYGRTCSLALEDLTRWVFGLRPLRGMAWWERVTRPDAALGREHGDTILACLRETDYGRE